jgi:two-component system response regulator CssR
MKKVINVVEDEKDLNELVKRYLEKEGYAVNSYLTFDEAYSHLDDYCDLWILDIMLDDKSGFDLIEEIKSRNKNMPVIFMSARDKEFDRIIGLEKGSDDYITKPFEMDILELKIRNVFVNRRKLHSYYLSRMNIKKSEENIHSDTKTLKDDIDSSFLQTLTQVINDNISNSEFTVNDLCNAVALSRTLLYEKTRKLLGLAPNDLIREIRMKQAKAWLEEGHFSVTTVAIQCGYPDVRYFSTVFKKYYGISPSKIIPVTDKRLLD